MNRRKLLSLMGMAALPSLGTCPAAAQSYPSRTVRIVIPFGPGGPTEFILRLIADRLQSALGQSFVIENRPGGAGGTVGAKSVAVADPDGYTLLFSSPGPLVMTVHDAANRTFAVAGVYNTFSFGGANGAITIDYDSDQFLCSGFGN